MKAIRLTRALRENLGPHYNEGEIVSLPEPKADLWIAKGWAVEHRPAPAPAPAPAPGKELDRPPVDRQIKRPPVKK